MDKRYRTRFQVSAKKNNYSDLHFQKTDSSFKLKSALDSKDKDLYYDEVIYYDGGDVHGYGDS